MDGTNFTRRAFFLFYMFYLEAKLSGRAILDKKDVFQLPESKTATECEGRSLLQSEWVMGAFQVKRHELRLAQSLSN